MSNFISSLVFLLLFVGISDVAASTFSPGKVCDASFAKLGKENKIYLSLAQIVDKYKKFTSIQTQENIAFRAFAMEQEREYGHYTQSVASSQSQEKNNLLFWDVEVAVLKQLNDEVVRDKSVVTSLVNMHKQMLWDEIQKNKDVSSKLLMHYSDFKKMRFTFSDDSPALKLKLSTILSRVNKSYAERIEGLPESVQWFKSANGMAASARNWFHGGVGNTADEAGLAARFSRADLTEDISLMKDASFLGGQVEKAADEVEKMREALVNRFFSVEGFWVSDGGASRVLSAEAIDAIRKLTPIGNTEQSWINSFKYMMRTRFKAEASSGDALLVKKYLDTADFFSPGIYVDERVVLDLERKMTGMVSADFKGQNSKNTEETLRALMRTKGKPLPMMLREVREGERRATAYLDHKKDIYRSVVDKMDSSVDKYVSFSGDDGMYFPSKSLNHDDKKAFMQKYLLEGEADDLRLTFVSTEYADTKKAIPDFYKSRLVGEAEKLEKTLRSMLIDYIPRQELNDTMIAIDYRPRANGSAYIGVFLAAENGRDSVKMRQLVQSYLKRNGFKVDFVESVGKNSGKVFHHQEIPLQDWRLYPTQWWKWSAASFPCVA